MQRDLLKAQFAKLPHLPAIHPDQQLEELDDDEAEESLDSFPAELSSSAPRAPRRRIPPGADYSPLSGSSYFSTALEVDVPISSIYQPLPPASPSNSSGSSGTAQFRVYYTPPPLASSSSALDDDDDEDEEGAGSGKGVVFVCVHGAGYSGLSWACLAKELAEPAGGEGRKGRVGVLAYDARGHGKTTLPPPSAGESTTVDLSLQTQSNDLYELLKAVYPDRAEAPSLVLVGHSMGGAVVADACNRIQKDVADVTGVVVVDVVEGTAIDALPGMAALIAGHPKTFTSPEDAIAWHLQSRTINNPQSARLSVPPLVMPSASSSEGEEEYVWRVDLAETEPYWRGWFTGLSAKFLACRAAKLLLLAGTDRLDRELLIGQMQGKYQLEVDPHVGHCVHEDAPERTAETLLSFWERNDRTDVLKGVKKVGAPA
ncbi:hypothetical protein JCM8547_002037 [Rhodosporidiobolus lusitaniae]